MSTETVPVWLAGNSICGDSREVVIAAIKKEALKLGDFTLTSGKKSKYYLDMKQITLDPICLKIIGAQFFSSMMTLTPVPDAVGGMSIGADPLTAAVMLASNHLRGFMIRKESKGHGTNQFLEGPIQKGHLAVIVEDVTTTGGSSLKAVERAVEFGAKVAAVYTVVDRLEGGREAIEGLGYKFYSLLTIEDLGVEPNKE